MSLKQNYLNWILLALLGSSVNLSAVITVELFSGEDNLPAVALGDSLNNRSDLDPGYAAIFNDSHTSYSGTSDFEFARYYPEESAVCVYWFGADEVPVTYYDSYASVHWLGYGNSTLVDGAKWGSDNFIHVVSSEITVGILQFNFDELSESATLIAAALDEGGLNFADGVAAIQAASVPEPSTYAGILAITVLFYVARRHRGTKA